MKTSYIFLLLSMFFSINIYSQSLKYIASNEQKIINDNSELVHKGEIVQFDKDGFFYFDKFTNHEIIITVTKLNDNNSIELGLNNLVLLNRHSFSTKLEKYVWILQYNIELLTLKQNQIEKFIFEKSDYWKNYRQIVLDETGEVSEPWYEYYSPLYLQLDNNYLNFSPFYGNRSLYLLVSQIDINNNHIEYDIFSKHVGNVSYLQPGYELLNNNNTPYNLIFVQDGDYLDMYIDSVNEDNHIFTYVRGTKEMAQEIEHFVRRESYDPSKVLWPRHADGTSDYHKDIILNHTTGYSYLTLENCILLESPTLNSKAITELNKDEVLTIIEQGKEELIEGVQSHWLKVTTDDNKEGWVYGGNVSLNDAVSKTEQEQYKKEHDDLVKLTSKVEKQIEREAKKKTN
ncbi:SH3 domain-containing protein [Spirochaeta cellobiosiphila]|uniref:SH3 domain-containing protein n=1 Tax=Spirochaeta cellobiosiphila TaxID=504483 RepID=UPI0003F74DAB|nr:SH3 domain-containing protein [Spirochaeta cellobiosiphila]